jgi:hypothetical protein
MCDYVVADGNDLTVTREVVSIAGNAVVIKGHDSRGVCVATSSEPIWDEIAEVNGMIGSRMRAAYKSAQCHIKFEWQEITSEQENAIREYANFWGYDILERESYLLMSW